MPIGSGMALGLSPYNLCGYTGIASALDTGYIPFRPPGIGGLKGTV
tara:strand:- start:1892 stop:2029 length:138 start_codon:yes stop_codon:yes gene_type:complete